MISFIADGEVVVVRNPELNNVEEFFWNNDIGFDYDGNPHSTSPGLLETRSLEFKRVNSKNYRALVELIKLYAFDEINFIDWNGTQKIVRIMQKDLLAKCETNDDYSFSIKLEVVR